MRQKNGIVDTGETVREEITSLYNQDDWRSAVEYLNEGEHKPLLLWLRPTLPMFEFFKEQLKAFSITGILSLGCGTGLLEWLIQSATGVKVTGVEVDKDWWTSAYAPPTFLPLNYPDDGEVIASLEQPSTALLFCYFNCEPAWKEYLAQFKGPLVLVCGPVKGCGTHSNPQPFQLLSPEWTVIAGTQVGDTHDSVAVYARVDLDSSL